MALLSLSVVASELKFLTFAVAVGLGANGFAVAVGACVAAREPGPAACIADLKDIAGLFAAASLLGTPAARGKVLTFAEDIADIFVWICAFARELLRIEVGLFDPVAVLAGFENADISAAVYAFVLPRHACFAVFAGSFAAIGAERRAPPGSIFAFDDGVIFAD